MADVSSVPFVNYGDSIAGQQLKTAEAGRAQANTSLVGQQTQAAAMANQLTKARMPLIMQALSDYNDGTQQSADASGVAQSKTSGKASPNDSGEEDPNSSWYNPAQIDSGLRNHYFVPPVTPDEAKRIQRAALIGDPGLLDAEKSRRQFRIDQQTAASQYDANNTYEALHAVVDADPGTALAQLAAVYPDTVKKIKATISDEADEDAAARAFAAHVGGTVHQYSGRKAVTRPDGTYVDEVTGRAIPGVEKSGLTEEQWAGIAKAGVQLVDMNDGQGHVVKIPQWQANKAPSLDAWVMQQAAHTGDHGSQVTVGGAPKAVARAAAAAGIAANAKATPKPEPSDQAGATMTDGKADPVLSAALADKDYKYVPPRQPFGTALSPDEQDQKTAQTKAAVSLKEDMDKGLPAAQTALTFYKAAQDILDSKGASTGKWQKVIATVGQWLPGVKIDASTNYQELAKYLGNAALQSGKAIFPKMTDKAAGLSLEKLNPAPDMTDDAVRNMLKTGSAVAQYSLDGAKKAGAYLRTGGDATRFQSWLNKYYPMADYVADAAKGKSAAPASASAPKYSDAQISGWANKHGYTVEQARKLLVK